MNERPYGTIDGTCEDPLYLYNCLVDSSQNSTVYHGGNNESWLMGEFACAACSNRDNAISILEGGPFPALASAYEYNWQGGRSIPMCVRPSDVVGGWPELRVTYAGTRFDTISGGTYTGPPACLAGEIRINTNSLNGPINFGLVKDGSIFCGGGSDQGCQDRLSPLISNLPNVDIEDVACGLPPLDPSNVQAACGIGGIGVDPDPFVSTPDLVLGSTWSEEVDCTDKGDTVECIVSESMVDDIIGKPVALFGGASLEINPASGAIEILDRTRFSGAALLKLRRGDAIIGLGKNNGSPSDPDVALGALADLRNQGETWALVDDGDREVTYHIQTR